MRFVLAALLLVLVAAPASADTCRRTGVTTRCSDSSSIQLVNGHWLYRPAPTTQVLTWTWPFIIPAREVRQVRQPRLGSPR
jgi:hypothetical protein